MKSFLLIAAALLAICLTQGVSAQEVEAAPPSILVVTMDDLGTDQLKTYLESAPACTPFLDSLVASGTRFERAYANSICSPTRAAWLTGRYGFRTGIGNAVREGHQTQGFGLQLSEVTLAKHLKANGYATWAAGKWHLDGTGHDDTHPNELGFEHYRGDLGGAPGSRPPPPNYFDWNRTVDGTTALDTRYVTTVMTEDVLELMRAPGPWFGYVNFNLPHSPYHAPPVGACQGGEGCPCPDPGAVGPDTYPSMIQSLDMHLATIVEEARRVTEGNLIVMVWGDNGTPRGVPANAPCPRGGKALFYEGGIHVPLVVSGIGVDAGHATRALVSPTDLFATVCELAGVPTASSAVDSVSFARALSGGDGLRDHVYLEWFSNNGANGPRANHRRAVVEQRWKLIRRAPSPVLPTEELFDLENDPCEGIDLLLSSPGEEARAAYARLEGRLKKLGVE